MLELISSDKRILRKYSEAIARHNSYENLSIRGIPGLIDEEDERKTRENYETLTSELERRGYAPISLQEYQKISSKEIERMINEDEGNIITRELDRRISNQISTIILKSYKNGENAHNLETMEA